MLLWSPELSTAKEKKELKSWTGPYTVKERLGRAGSVIKSDVGGRVVPAHGNRLRHTGRGVNGKTEPSNSIFLDSLRNFEKILEVESRHNP